MDYLKEQFEQMYNWDYEREEVLEVKMEDLTRNPAEGYTEILRFLGLLDESDREGATGWWHSVVLKMNRLNHKGRRFMPGNLPMFPFPKRRLPGIPASAISAVLERKSFARLAGGRKKGQEDVNSHYRKGTPGDWKNHFSAEHIRQFKDQYGDLLIKLGYESSPDW
jgi:hypothetical protein